MYVCEMRATMSPIRSSRLWTRCWDKQRQIILRIKVPSAPQQRYCGTSLLVL
ncbi:hypothetical protein Plhal304r1_c013g0050851 [Plasmopara halstedii]